MFLLQICQPLYKQTLAADVTADAPAVGVADCHVNLTDNRVSEAGTVCPFSVTRSVYSIVGRPLATFGEIEETGSSSWTLHRDIMVWRTDDKEGTFRCFADAVANVSETVWPDGSSNNTVDGDVLMTIPPSQSVAEGVTAISSPGMYFQVSGQRKRTIDADGHTTYTYAEGDYIDMCKLLSETTDDALPVPAAPSTNANETDATATPAPAPSAMEPPSSSPANNAAWLAAFFMLPASAYLLF